MQSSLTSFEIGNEVIDIICSKKSILTKKPLKIGFRDMENDLSTKFYAVNKNNSESEAKHI